MAAPQSAYKDRHFLAVIGDEVNCSQAVNSYLNRRGLGFCDRPVTRWHRRKLYESHLFDSDIGKLMQSS